VAYGMAPLPMTLHDREGHFCCLKSFSLPYIGKYHSVYYNTFTHESVSTHVPRNFNNLFKN